MEPFSKGPLKDCKSLITFVRDEISEDTELHIIQPRVSWPIAYIAQLLPLDEREKTLHSLRENFLDPSIHQLLLMHGNSISNNLRNNCQRMSEALEVNQFQEIDNALQAAQEQLDSIFVETNGGHNQVAGQDRESLVGRVRQTSGGAPRYDFDPSQLHHLLMAGFSVSRIARDGLLGQQVHRNTVLNHMRRSGIEQPRRVYGIGDEDLRTILAEYIQEHPNSGAEEIRAYLRTRDPPVVVSRTRVRDMVTSIDPVGVATRWSQVVSRRKYSVPGPNSLWHIDSHHALMRYGIYVHGCVDGSSRLVMYLKASPFNTARVAFQSFVSGVQQYGIPSRIRVDGGVENGFIKQFMVAANGEGRGSYIEGRSVHNQRIERLWRDVFQKVIFIVYQTLHALEDVGALDVSNPVHIFCAQTVFLPRLNNSLESWRLTRNHQPLRTEHNQTPEQLWMSRLAAQRHSDSTALRNIQEERDVSAIVDQVLPGGEQFSASSFLMPRSTPQVSQEAVEGIQQFDVLKTVGDFGVGLYGEILQFVTELL